MQLSAIGIELAQGKGDAQTAEQFGLRMRTSYTAPSLQLPDLHGDAVAAPATGALHSLCELATEVVPCDCSYAFSWDPTADAYVAIASGIASLAQVNGELPVVPRALVPDLHARLQQDKSVQLRASEPQMLLWVPPGLRGESLTGLYVPLRHEQETIGVLAIYRTAQTGLSTLEVRRARRLAPLVSAALESGLRLRNLARASHLGSDFVTTVSHELRTPLGVLVNYHDLLLAGQFDPLTPAQAEVVQRLKQSVRACLEVVVTSLDLVRVEAEQVPLSVCATRASALFDDIGGETRLFLPDSGRQVVWDVAPDLPTLHTDPEKLKIILRNLLTNAMKFTPQGGTVSMRAMQRGDGVEFDVTDTGPGIPADALARIFEPFVQLQGRNGNARGLGLGLYIVRRLVDVLGGRVTVESEVGCGTTFRVCLPLRGAVGHVEPERELFRAASGS